MTHFSHYLKCDNFIPLFQVLPIFLLFQVMAIFPIMSGSTHFSHCCIYPGLPQHFCELLCNYDLTLFSNYDPFFLSLRHFSKYFRLSLVSPKNISGLNCLKLCIFSASSLFFFTLFKLFRIGSNNNWVFLFRRLKP